MNASTVKSWGERVLQSLPEIWFILVSTVWFLLLSGNLTEIGWTTKSVMLPAVLLVIIGVLIKQLIRKGSWARFLLGMLFTICSFFVFMAVLYKYHEFPLKTDPNALKLIIVGCGLASLSLVLSIKILMSGLHKMYSW